VQEVTVCALLVNGSDNSNMQQYQLGKNR